MNGQRTLDAGLLSGSVGEEVIRLSGRYVAASHVMEYGKRCKRSVLNRSPRP